MKSATIRVLYFAQLRDSSGRDEELLPLRVAGVTTPADCFSELALRYGFPLARKVVRAAVNGRYTTWDHPLEDGDELAFIPPVAGG